MSRSTSRRMFAVVAVTSQHEAVLHSQSNHVQTRIAQSGKCREREREGEGESKTCAFWPSGVRSSPNPNSKPKSQLSGGGMSKRASRILKAERLFRTSASLCTHGGFVQSYPEICYVRDVLHNSCRASCRPTPNPLAISQA